MANDTRELTIPAIKVETLQLKLASDSPLIVHKWSEKAKKEILDKQMKVAKTKGHDVRNPIADFIMSLYWLDGEPTEYTEAAFAKALAAGARFGFPSVAFKASAVAAGYRAGVLKDRVSTNAAMHIDGEMVEIIGTPVMREDMVRVGMGTADLRYRGMFEAWSALITVRYNAGAITPEQIANLFNLGGFGCGVGEWRPEKGGQYGMYHVE